MNWHCTKIPHAFLLATPLQKKNTRDVKSLSSLLLALLIVAVIGGTAWFYWDISEGARFERVKEAPDSDNPELSEPPIDIPPAVDRVPNTTPA